MTAYFEFTCNLYNCYFSVIKTLHLLEVRLSVTQIQFFSHICPNELHCVSHLPTFVIFIGEEFIHVFVHLWCTITIYQGQNAYISRR